MTTPESERSPSDHLVEAVLRDVLNGAAGDGVSACPTLPEIVVYTRYGVLPGSDEHLQHCQDCNDRLAEAWASWCPPEAVVARSHGRAAIDPAPPGLTTHMRRCERCRDVVQMLEARPPGSEGSWYVFVRVGDGVGVGVDLLASRTTVVRASSRDDVPDVASRDFARRLIAELGGEPDGAELAGPVDLDPQREVVDLLVAYAAAADRAARTGARLWSLDAAVAGQALRAHLPAPHRTDTFAAELRSHALRAAGLLETLPEEVLANGRDELRAALMGPRDGGASDTPLQVIAGLTDHTLAARFAARLDAAVTQIEPSRGEEAAPPVLAVPTLGALTTSPVGWKPVVAGLCDAAADVTAQVHPDRDHRVEVGIPLRREVDAALAHVNERLARLDRDEIEEGPGSSAALDRALADHWLAVLDGEAAGFGLESADVRSGNMGADVHGDGSPVVPTLYISIVTTDGAVLAVARVDELDPDEPAVVRGATPRTSAVRALDWRPVAELDEHRAGDDGSALVRALVGAPLAPFAVARSLLDLVDHVPEALRGWCLAAAIRLLQETSAEDSARPDVLDFAGRLSESAQHLLDRMPPAPFGFAALTSPVAGAVARCAIAVRRDLRSVMRDELGDARQVSAANDRGSGRVQHLRELGRSVDELLLGTVPVDGDPR